MRSRASCRRPRTGILAALGAVLLLAAPAWSGTLGDPYELGGGASDPGTNPESIQVAPRLRFPRLSHRQWESTVADLFQLDGPSGLSASFTPDPLGGKAFDN